MLSEHSEVCDVIISGKQYDLIIGPVADDTVLPTIQAFVIGQFTVEAAIIGLKTSKLFDQHCLTTEKAISMLNFKESFVIKGEN